MKVTAQRSMRCRRGAEGWPFPRERCSGASPRPCSAHADRPPLPTLPHACSGDIALKLVSNNRLPCAIWQLTAVTPKGPSQNLVGVPVTIKSTCRMAPNPTCNAFLTGPSMCTDGYTNMGAGGQWIIEAVGSRYRLRSLVRRDTS